MLSTDDFDKVLKLKYKIKDRKVDKLDYIALINELEEENSRYKQGLEYYADKRNYQTGRCEYLGELNSAVQTDEGEIARKSLKEAK